MEAANLFGEVRACCWKVCGELDLSEGIGAALVGTLEEVAAVLAVPQHRMEPVQSVGAVEDILGEKTIVADIVGLEESVNALQLGYIVQTLLLIRSVVSLRILLWRCSLRWIPATITLLVTTILVCGLGLGHGCIQ